MSGQNGAKTRTSKRVSIVLRGSIIDNEKVMDVLVNDLSRRGAKLRIAESEGPESTSFRLRVPNVGEFNAKLCWRKEDILGVEFDEGSKEVFKRAAPYITSLPVAPWAAK